MTRGRGGSIVAGLREAGRAPRAAANAPGSQTPATGGRLIVLMVLLLLFPGRGFAQEPMEDDAPLGLGDLAAERAALSGKFENDEPPRPTTFRELWDHPGENRGRRVIVSGRIVRIFRQDPSGDFPALVEAWIEEPPGNLFCAVFEPRPDADVEIGRLVAFTGVHLRRIRYEAGGGARLAPLIVGAEPPRIEKPAPADKGKAVAPPAPAPGRPGSGLAWTLVWLAALAAVAAILARRSLYGQPPRRRRRPIGEDGDFRASPESVPEFIEPESDDDDPR